MPVSLPPIPEAAFRDHQETRFRDSSEQALVALERDRDTLAASEAAAEEEFLQRSDAELEDIRAVQTRGDEERAFLDRSEAELADLARPLAPQPRPVPQGGLAVSPASRDLYASEGGPLQRVYQDARRAGLDDEGARVAAAIAQTEHGYEGALGDQGASAGTFQLHHAGGMGNAYAASRGLSPEQSIAALREDPHAANDWALRGYLGQAIREGQAQGLSGADLATYAQRYGQRSVSPERAGANYSALQGQDFGQAAAESVSGPDRAPAREPAPFERADVGDER